MGSNLFLEPKGLNDPRRLFRQDRNGFWEWTPYETYLSDGEQFTRWYGFGNGKNGPQNLKELGNV